MFKLQITVINNLARKTHKNLPFGTPTCRCQENIKMGFKEIKFEDTYDSRESPKAACCEHNKSILVP